MTTTRRLTFYTDPGHGWLEVPRADLEALGIAADITPYSFAKYGRAYLEEDLDATRYLEAARAAGWRVTMREQYADPCPIRDFPRYQPSAVIPLMQALEQMGKLSIVNIKG